MPTCCLHLESGYSSKIPVKSQIFLHEIWPCGPSHRRHASKKMPREGPDDSAGWGGWMDVVKLAKITPMTGALLDFAALFEKHHVSLI